MSDNNPVVSNEEIDRSVFNDTTIIKSEAEEVVVEEGKVEALQVTENPLLTGVIRVYQNSIPWNNRNNATLLALGKVLGVNYFIHPLIDLSKGIPKDTKVVLIASNSAGSKQAAVEENLPKAQRNLECFVQRGGVLIVDMADNLEDGGYIAPGAVGTPNLIFPDTIVANKLYLTKESYCSPFVNGPTITLTDNNISMPPGVRYSAHGNLVDGIKLPNRAEILMTAIFKGVRKPVLASYYLGDGFVILDTVTKEFQGQYPQGFGPSNIITNLIFYAYYLGKIF